MSIIFESRAERLLARSRESPCIPFVTVPVDDLVTDCRGRHFPDLRRVVRTYFVDRGNLACIFIPKDVDAPATIFIHQILNRTETPELVLQLIVAHELLHLEIGGREVDGRFTMHPPEFALREAELLPERDLAWAWIRWNFGAVIRSDRKRECTPVRASWRKAARAHCVPLDRIVEISQALAKPVLL